MFYSDQAPASYLLLCLEAICHGLIALTLTKWLHLSNLVALEYPSRQVLYLTYLGLYHLMICGFALFIHLNHVLLV